MPMERHRCKLCLRFFSNGRALGGHMKSHLATLPLPCKKKIVQQHDSVQLGHDTDSDSSSTQLDHHTNLCDYGVLENQKKGVKKGSNHEFLDAGSVVQDRESENESTRTPTRKRFKRCEQDGFVMMKTESVTESTPVSSVSDASQDEEVALCLMMLSRDVWVNRVVVNEGNSVEDTSDSPELKTRPRTRWAKFKCLSCKKIFKTNKGLSEHKATNKECKNYECPFCNKVFKSGQALGGHKRSHLLGSSNNNNSTKNEVSKNRNVSIFEKVNDTTTSTSFVLDLNLPAPVTDDEDHSQFGFP